jgi:hypothetical protein
MFSDDLVSGAEYRLLDLKNQGADLKHVRKYFFAASHFLILTKNYDLANLALLLMALVFVEPVHSATLLPRELRRALAKFRAILWCLRNLRKTWVKRLFVQARVRRVPDREVMRCMCRPSVLAARASASVFY